MFYEKKYTSGPRFMHLIDALTNSTSIFHKPNQSLWFPLGGEMWLNTKESRGRRSTRCHPYIGVRKLTDWWSGPMMTLRGEGSGRVQCLDRKMIVQ